MKKCVLVIGDGGFGSYYMAKAILSMLNKQPNKGAQRSLSYHSNLHCFDY